MDYRDFTKRKTAYDGFVKMRKEILDNIDNPDFNDLFTELCTKALAGDCIAQDVVAYFFNKGIPDRIHPNYDFYMRWQFLAGANGNEFALEKMEFFLNSALEELTDEEEILRRALLRGNITKDNALMVMSNLLCEGVVDQLKINPKDLITFGKKAELYSPQKNRPYIDAINNSIVPVAQYLIS